MSGCLFWHLGHIPTSGDALWPVVKGKVVRLGIKPALAVCGDQALTIAIEIDSIFVVGARECGIGAIRLVVRRAILINPRAIEDAELIHGAVMNDAATESEVRVDAGIGRRDALSFSSATRACKQNVLRHNNSSSRDNETHLPGIQQSQKPLRAPVGHAIVTPVPHAPKREAKRLLAAAPLVAEGQARPQPALVPRALLVPLRPHRVVAPRAHGVQFLGARDPAPQRHRRHDREPHVGALGAEGAEVAEGVVAGVALVLGGEGAGGVGAGDGACG
ncbi:hypothetical protein BDY21DRAFT_351462 [Lineolata rhizophorae]|uniref:Uncharacterized protein n=1 Tax=Lineolata rhizophorae TaxID=578093 RepID=A0A6A6NTW1_9PEZI|nr:hypothetical protein BDY21DRAFT_351462 [Lineolata rhizophorae]